MAQPLLPLTHMFGYLAYINLLQLPSQSATQPECLKQQNVSSHSAAGEKSKNQSVSRWGPPEGLDSPSICHEVMGLDAMILVF